MSSSSWLLDKGGDTIAALTTPPGRSAVALIRLSGDRAFEITRQVTHAELPPARRQLLRSIFRNGGGDAIERCLLTPFPGPNSYTGEDTVEFSVHGGFLVSAIVLEQLLLAGAREALPGEFTRRAVLNGKLDLLQAEAVADLIDSRSRGAAAAALRQLDGGLTRRITALRNSILDVEAFVAYDIDFPEEDDGPIERSRILAASDEVVTQLGVLLATAGVGEMLREGALVVIAGAPNTGKSSLFNALIGSRRSLVTDIPGTTRDAIEAVVDADEWTLRLVDTAGLRSTAEVVERLGIEVAEEYLGRAQVVLVCGDNDDLLRDALVRVLPLTEAPIVAVVTKSDLYNNNSLGSKLPGTDSRRIASTCQVSAISGAGLANLLQELKQVLGKSQTTQETGAPLLLRARHQHAVSLAQEEMRHFVSALTEDVLPMPVAGTHLRAAADALESLIGAVGVEDVLDRVFSTFCVGK